jgi:hypothetical protein
MIAILATSQNWTQKKGKKKKTTEVSQSKWSGEKDEKKTLLQTDNSVDSTTTLMFGVPPQTGVLCCCPVPVPVEQIIVHNFCLRFARRPRSAPRDAERQLSFPPTPVKAPHCRVRSDNKIKMT